MGREGLCEDRWGPFSPSLLGCVAGIVVGGGHDSGTKGSARLLYQCGFTISTTNLPCFSMS